MIFIINSILFLLVQEHRLELQMQVPKAEGKIYVAVYHDSDEFMSEASIERVEEVTSTVLSVSIPMNKSGKYAVAVFQDLNGDGKLSTNFVGVPTEPYGFSNNARGSFGPPKFSEASFFIEGQTTHSLILE